MKVEIKEEEEQFKPIEIKIVIQNEDELICLLAALNTTNDMRKECISTSILQKDIIITSDTVLYIWEKVGKPLLKIYNDNKE